MHCEVCVCTHETGSQCIPYDRTACRSTCGQLISSDPLWCERPVCYTTTKLEARIIKPEMHKCQGTAEMIIPILNVLK